MSEIITSELNEDKINLGATHDELRLYDGLVTPISEDLLILSDKHKQQIEKYTEKAASKYGDQAGRPEETFAFLEHGVPALVVRVDCTINNGEIIPYEMEDSPSGQGITDTIHRSIGGVGIKNAILGHYDSTIGQIPHIIVSNQRSHGTDDQLIVGYENYSYGADTKKLEEDALVIVKSIPGHPASHQPYIHLQERAVAPLTTEGNKSYAERIGDITAVSHESELLLNENGELRSQVLKSRIGSMAMGVSIYLEPSDRKKFGKRGIVTATKLKSNLDTYTQDLGGGLTQEFAPPIQTENPEGRSNAILRIFVLLEKDNGTPNKIKAEAIGGCYVARPELIVHGAANSVGGAVMVE